MTGEIDSLRLRRVLDDIAAEGMRGDVDLWPKVSTAVTKRRGLPRLRKAWAVPALAIVALASVAAVTVGPRMIDELDSLLFANQGIEADFGDPVEFGLEQTVGGVTVNLGSVRVTRLEAAEGVVQDGQLSLEYTLYGFPDRQNEMPEISDGPAVLTDQLGREFPVLIGMGTDSTSEIFGGEVEPGGVKAIFAFDLWGATLDGNELRLRLEVPLLRFHEVEGQEPEALTDGRGNVIGSTASRVETEEIGRFEFEFTVPVTVVPGEVRDGPGQSARPKVLPPTPVAQ
jgi:hypothetical protein